MGDIDSEKDVNPDCASSESFAYAADQNDIERSSDFVHKDADQGEGEDSGEQQEDGDPTRKKSMENKCIPCEFAEEDSIATTFCLNCPEHEPMCGECADQHLRERETRGHKLCKDLAKLRLMPSVSKNMYCESCKKNGNTRNAIGFCLTCDKPYPFCNECAKLHVKEKISHEVILHESPVTKSVICNLCFSESHEVSATHFCLDCKKPEPMCEKCAKRHIKQPCGRGHTLCKDINKFPGLSQLEERTTEKNQKTPGKPTALKILSDTVELVWEELNDVNYYEVRYKQIGVQETWKFARTDSCHNEIIINGLLPDKKYIFQVRAMFQDHEGSYGPANEELKTEISYSGLLLEHAIKVSDGNPALYQLQTQENKQLRNEVGKTRKLFFGSRGEGLEEEKTILLIGATGSGKTTLVDGIVNYIMGVNFNDPFRFTIVQPEKEENKVHDQALSQTEWISVYRIANQKGSRLNYALNIIDTPGFGDTRGIERDQEITKHLTEFFSSSDGKGIMYLDAVCFIVKAPDARLTVSQHYIFNSIMSLFGKDIKTNICMLITFADGAKPPVIASLKAANLPYGSSFEFNNSALFAENKDLPQTSMSTMFWEIGCNSFKKFFDHLSGLESRSVSQTKDVLMKREQLQLIVARILHNVKAGLSKLTTLRTHLRNFEMHKQDIENNKDFEYEVEEVKQHRISLPAGRPTTNCINCNITCHENCAYADDKQKMLCCAMSNGNCTVCDGKCKWNDHHNNPYIFTYTLEKVKRTFKDVKKKFEEANEKRLSDEQFIGALVEDVDNLFQYIEQKMEEMRQCKEKLRDIALRPDPLSEENYINLLIEAEKKEGQPGFENRILVLEEIKAKALIDNEFATFGNTLKSTKHAISSAGANLASSKKTNKDSLMKQGAKYLQRFFKF